MRHLSPRGRWDPIFSPKLMIFLLIVMFFVLMLKTRQLDFWTVPIKVQRPLPANRSSMLSQQSKDFCRFPPLFPEDALEEHYLLDLVAWPKTPPLNTTLSETSSPKNSIFTIVPGRDEWHVGDQLQVRIQIKDFRNVAKKSGGDVIVARLHNQDLQAGVSGHVVDHLNGSYTASFPLLWTGGATVEVILVHPSEAVTVLRRLNAEEPDRVNFVSVFKLGSLSESLICNICFRPTEAPLCNFTDILTGEPWFCSKPKELNCDSRINHAMGHFHLKLKAEETKFFQSGTNMKVKIKSSGPTSIKVLPNPNSDDPQLQKPEPRPSGYYYNGEWRALVGAAVQNFPDPAAISQCLRGKSLHMYGDSTVRQFYEYLVATLPDLNDFDLHSSKMTGPFVAFDSTHNIQVKYRPHGVPIRIKPIATTELRYIATDLDTISGGPNTVVILGIWAHFGTFPIEIYVHRLQNIRRSVIRMLNRSPDTVVIIRTANPKELEINKAVLNSDWYSLQRDKILRAIFKGVKVHWLDAWDMVLAHHHPHMLHPPPPIIKNMINVILTYICPHTTS
ncbi:NXPE family member 3-like isoform 1-T6 [Synchiropus picturatus]